MNELLIQAESLAALLVEENAALAALDLPRAAAMLRDKQRAAEALATARPLAITALIDAAQQREAAALGLRLAALAAENRRLLERAIAVQAKVIEIIARAGRRDIARRAAVYGARGTPISGARPPAMAISARA